MLLCAKVLSANECTGWVHVKLNYIRVIKLRVSSRTIVDALSFSLPSPFSPFLSFGLFLSFSFSCRAFDLRQPQIRVTLNDLFDPVGRTYICKISFVLQRYFRTKRPRIRNFAPATFAFNLVDIRILILDWRTFPLYLRGEYFYDFRTRILWYSDARIINVWKWWYTWMKTIKLIINYDVQSTNGFSINNWIDASSLIFWNLWIFKKDTIKFY